MLKNALAKHLGRDDAEDLGAEAALALVDAIKAEDPASIQDAFRALMLACSEESSDEPEPGPGLKIKIGG